MGAGTLMHPGRHPARAFRAPARQRAVQVAPPVVEVGIRVRRGQQGGRHPSARFRFPKRPRAYLSVGGGAGILPGFGAAGAAVFVLGIEAGAQTTYTWSTAIYETFDGKESRESPYGQPRRRFEGTAFLVDSSSRDARGALARSAASGSTFLLALPHEEMTVSSDSLATVVTVASTALCDWARARQRVVIVGTSGTKALAVIQSVTATTITIATVDASDTLTFGVLGSVGAAGARIMPLVQVVLDPQQGFARYPVNVDLWSIRATATAFGWAGVDAMGVGATLTTYTAGTAIPVASVTSADLLIWDRPNAIDGTANEAMLSQTEVVDMGALQYAAGGASAPIWGRSLKYRSSSDIDKQYVKAFLRTVRGRQRAFLLSTNGPDFLFVSFLGATLKIFSGSTAGAGDYAGWFTSQAERRLALTLDTGAMQYVTVTATADNGDGTLTLTLDATVLGSVARVSLLEQVRFADDNIKLAWDGATFSLDESLVTTQESIFVSPPVVVPPDSDMFDAQLTMPLAVFDGTTASRSILITGTLGKSTLVYTSCVNSLANPTSYFIVGIAASGGNVDGMVVAMPNQVSSADAFAGTGTTIVHESSLATAVNRFFCPGAVNRSASTGGCAIFRYSGALSRWVSIL